MILQNITKITQFKIYADVFLLKQVTKPHISQPWGVLVTSFLNPIIPLTDLTGA